MGDGHVLRILNLIRLKIGRLDKQAMSYSSQMYSTRGGARKLW